METDNRSPFAVNVSVAMDGSGFEQLLLVAKGTFNLGELRDSHPVLAEEPAAVELGDTFRGDPECTSLESASELQPSKPGTDVMLSGHAWPRTHGDKYTDVALRVSTLTKTIRAFGDRVWTTGVHALVPGAPAPMKAVPLTYENAFGGRDEAGSVPGFCRANPAGTGYRSKTNPVDFRGQQTPRLELPSQPLSSPGITGAPASFGPIPPHWEPRAALAGTYDDRWQRDRAPLLPSDFDSRFHQLVPPDQVLPEFLRGSEEVAVVGATPRDPIAFMVPRDRPTFRVLFRNGEERLHPDCDSLAIDTDKMTLSLVWRASLCVQDRVPYLSGVQVGHRSRRRVLRR